MYYLPVCNICNDVLKIPMNLNNIAILIIYGNDYRCIINEMSKSEATNLFKN